jgi:hypothetical protein
VNPGVLMVIKSTVPWVHGQCAGQVRHRQHHLQPGISAGVQGALRQSAPQPIVVGAYDHQRREAEMFAALLQEGLRRRTCRCSSPIPRRRRPSSCSPTRIWRCG